MGFAEQRLHDDARGLRQRRPHEAAVLAHIGALDGLERQDAALAVEHHAVALGGVVGGQEVVDDGAALVGDQRLHGVFDVDVGAEHAAVADVAVVAFVVGVEAR